MDASLLQMVELRFIRADDPRFQATFAAVEKALRRGRNMLRYDSEDDFGQPETAFNICTFWLIEALRSEEHTSELQSLMRISYAVFCLKKKKNIINDIYSI